MFVFIYHILIVGEGVDEMDAQYDAIIALHDYQLIRC